MTMTAHSGISLPKHKLLHISKTSKKSTIEPRFALAFAKGLTVEQPRVTRGPAVITYLYLNSLLTRLNLGHETVG